MFFQVNQRLKEIFGYSGNKPFGGFPVIVCGTLDQLPLVKGSSVYSSATSIKGFLALDLREKFQMSELTEVMRQRGDYDFINLLNKIRSGRINEDVALTLKWRFLNEISHPKHVAHMFAKNKPVKRYNETQLGMLKSQLLCIDAIDEVPKVIVRLEQIDAIKQKKLVELAILLVN